MRSGREDEYHAEPQPPSGPRYARGPRGGDPDGIKVRGPAGDTPASIPPHGVFPGIWWPTHAGGYVQAEDYWGMGGHEGVSHKDFCLSFFINGGKEVKSKDNNKGEWDYGRCYIADHVPRLALWDYELWTTTPFPSFPCGLKPVIDGSKITYDGKLVPGMPGFKFVNNVYVTLSHDQDSYKRYVWVVRDDGPRFAKLTRNWIKGENPDPSSVASDYLAYATGYDICDANPCVYHDGSGGIYDGSYQGGGIWPAIKLHILLPRAPNKCTNLIADQIIPYHRIPYDAQIGTTENTQFEIADNRHLDAPIGAVDHVFGIDPASYDPRPGWGWLHDDAQGDQSSPRMDQRNFVGWDADVGAPYDTLQTTFGGSNQNLNEGAGAAFTASDAAIAAERPKGTIVAMIRRIDNSV